MQVLALTQGSKQRIRHRALTMKKMGEVGGAFVKLYFVVLPTTVLLFCRAMLSELINYRIIEYATFYMTGPMSEVCVSCLRLTVFRVSCFVFFVCVFSEKESRAKPKPKPTTFFEKFSKIIFFD